MEGELDTSYIMHDVYTIPHLALVEKWKVCIIPNRF
jgi:hypothetical protein